MEEKKEKFVIDGNDVYEIDLECMRKKQMQREGNSSKEETEKKKQGTWEKSPAGMPVSIRIRRIHCRRSRAEAGSAADSCCRRIRSHCCYSCCRRRNTSVRWSTEYSCSCCRLRKVLFRIRYRIHCHIRIHSWLLLNHSCWILQNLITLHLMSQPGNGWQKRGEEFDSEKGTRV